MEFCHTSPKAIPILQHRWGQWASADTGSVAKCLLSAFWLKSIVEFQPPKVPIVWIKTFTTDASLCVSIQCIEILASVSFHEKNRKVIHSLFIHRNLELGSGRARISEALKSWKTIITCDTMFSLWCRVTTFPISRQSQIIFSHTGRSSWVRLGYFWVL